MCRKAYDIDMELAVDREGEEEILVTSLCLEGIIGGRGIELL